MSKHHRPPSPTLSSSTSKNSNDRTSEMRSLGYCSNAQSLQYYPPSHERENCSSRMPYRHPQDHINRDFSESSSSSSTRSDARSFSYASDHFLPHPGWHGSLAQPRDFLTTHPIYSTEKKESAVPTRTRDGHIGYDNPEVCLAAVSTANSNKGDSGKSPVDEVNAQLLEEARVEAERAMICAQAAQARYQIIRNYVESNASAPKASTSMNGDESNQSSTDMHGHGSNQAGADVHHYGSAPCRADNGMCLNDPYPLPEGMQDPRGHFLHRGYNPPMSMIRGSPQDSSLPSMPTVNMNEPNNHGYDRQTWLSPPPSYHDTYQQANQHFGVQQKENHCKRSDGNPAQHRVGCRTNVEKSDTATRDKPGDDQSNCHETHQNTKEKDSTATAKTNDTQAKVTNKQKCASTSETGDKEDKQSDQEPVTTKPPCSDSEKKKSQGQKEDRPASNLDKAPPKKKGKYNKKKDPNKPRRPLSAYNIFFAQERANILNTNTKDGDLSGQEELPDEAMTRVLSRFDENLKGISRPRKKRRCHGKVSFFELARTIGKRWRSLPKEKQDRFKELAELDMKNYREAMDAYRAMTREEGNVV